jgi:hypothetical protein
VLLLRRSAGTSSALIGLPNEESRGLAHGFLLLAQDASASQAPQLLELLAGEALALALVDLGLAHPAAQRLRSYAELAGCLIDAARDGTQFAADPLSLQGAQFWAGDRCSAFTRRRRAWLAMPKWNSVIKVRAVDAWFDH